MKRKFAIAIVGLCVAILIAIAFVLLTPPSAINLSKTSYRLWKGESFDLNATHNYPVLWHSSDENIAIVDQNGLIKAIYNGTVTIAARSIVNPNIKANATIEVVAIKQIAAGNNHSAILDNNGDLYMAGGNGFGQLGLGDNPDIDDCGDRTDNCSIFFRAIPPPELN